MSSASREMPPPKVPPPKPEKTHPIPVFITDDSPRKNPYSLRNDEFSGWREPVQSGGITGSTIGGHRISNQSDHDFRDVLQARQTQNGNLRRRWRPSALNPAPSQEPANDVGENRNIGSRANSIGGNDKRAFDRDEPTEDPRPSKRVRGLQTTSIHRPDNRIQKPDPYYNRPGPRRVYGRGREPSYGSYHGAYHGHSNGARWSGRQSYSHSTDGRSLSYDRRFSGQSDRADRNYWNHRGSTHSSIFSGISTNSWVHENTEPVEYHTSNPAPDSKPAKGINFLGFPIEEIKGDWPKAVTHFFREGGGASSKCGDVETVIINAKNGDPVHRSVYNPDDTRSVVTAKVIGKLATRVCHIFLNGTGSGFLGDIEE